MLVLRAAEYRSMPWKNGGGVTTEVAVSPPGSGLDDFDWRISMARVESSGPFSRFAGIDRTLAVLEGEGIVLDIAGRPPVSLTTASAPLAFPADAPTEAALIAGPITDLNVMTRRGRTTHSVERVTFSAPLDIQAGADTVLVLSLDGAIAAGVAAPVELGPLDTLLLEPAAVSRLESAGTATVFLVRIAA